MVFNSINESANLFIFCSDLILWKSEGKLTTGCCGRWSVSQFPSTWLMGFKSSKCKISILILFIRAIPLATPHSSPQLTQHINTNDIRTYCYCSAIGVNATSNSVWPKSSGRFRRMFPSPNTQLKNIFPNNQIVDFNAWTNIKLYASLCHTPMNYPSISCHRALTLHWLIKFHCIACKCRV